MSYILSPSKRRDKKWQVVTPSGKIVHFGASGYEDYTMHKDITRYKRYIQRHQARENWEDPNTAGFWSRWILWNKPNFKESVKDTEKQFNIDIYVA
jgi:hypothetical protein